MPLHIDKETAKQQKCLKAFHLSEVKVIREEFKQGLMATQLSVLEALVVKVDENIHP